MHGPGVHLSTVPTCFRESVSARLEENRANQVTQVFSRNNIPQTMRIPVRKCNGRYETFLSWCHVRLLPQ